MRTAEVGGFDIMKNLLSPLLMNTDRQARNRANFLKSTPYMPCKADDRAW